MRYALLILTVLALAGCQEETTKSVEAEKAKRAANSIRFTENAEIENIKRRLELTADPGKLGYIVLFNETGQPILYEGVKGKVTSGSKRLTQPEQRIASMSDIIVSSPSDEGTYGSSNPYIFYWNMDGVYRQWSGHYLYSDQPTRLRIEPLVITGPITAAVAPPTVANPTVPQSK